MSATTTKFKDLSPLKTFANASKSCSTQSLAYGKCIGKSYQEVSKGMCETEFKAFKDCVQLKKAFGRRW